jgi:hypothetical protein
MNTSILKPPATLPLDWQAVKSQLRLDELQLGEQLDNTQAYVMNTLVASAAQTATNSLRLALIETQYETRCMPRELAYRSGLLTLLLPWGNALSVDSVTYGGTALVDGTDYQVPSDSTGKPLYPAGVQFDAGLFGHCCGGFWGYWNGWPGGAGCCGCAPDFDDVAAETLVVTYSSGFGLTPDDVPANIRSWMLARVGSLYANAEEITETRSVETLPFIDGLLADRNYTFS